jgi:hypothetical protein
MVRKSKGILFESSGQFIPGCQLVVRMAYPVRVAGGYVWVARRSVVVGGRAPYCSSRPLQGRNEGREAREMCRERLRAKGRGW